MVDRSPLSRDAVDFDVFGETSRRHARPLRLHNHAAAPGATATTAAATVDGRAAARRRRPTGAVSV